jgi:hypothetical protein
MRKYIYETLKTRLVNRVLDARKYLRILLPLQMAKFMWKMTNGFIVHRHYTLRNQSLFGDKFKLTEE